MRFAAVFLFLIAASGASGQAEASSALPNPVLYLTGYEFVTTGGKQVIRYLYSIDNYSAFPRELFAQSPELPPCGTNTRAARTWIEVYEQGGRRLNGFCAITDPALLNRIWFASDVNQIPPSWIYIELIDRKTGKKYKSNLAETTL
jgi:hypothetical protein